MYFKKIEIENVGPIDHLLVDFPIIESGNPKPLVIVGENGAGKSIFLSYLVNTLIAAKQAIFDDAEVNAGKVYKYRSPAYIKNGKHYSYGRVEFVNSQYVEEWQLDQPRSKFKEIYGFSPAKPSWTSIQEHDLSSFSSSFFRDKQGAKEIFNNKCCLYFPVNRFEEPAWLNLENLKDRPIYTELKSVAGYSNRNIISTSPLKDNRNWLFDIIFDRQTFERVIQPMEFPDSPIPEARKVLHFVGYQGQSSRIYEAILQLLRIIFNPDGVITIGPTRRHARTIAMLKNEALWIQNIFQLSTGETLLLDLFLSMLRDYDLSGGSLDSLSDVRGIVIIDEIDVHLHTRHQKEILPNLIASFPNVQFVITTHSPLFLLGMEEKFGSDGFMAINMPNGDVISASDFSEFTAAYEAFKQTKLHRQEIMNILKANSRPIVFVEGELDIRYIQKAAELLGMSDILEAIQLKDGGGFGNLDKIWKSYEVQLAELLPSKILLLYDCDKKRESEQKGKILRRTIPRIANAPITVGIENLVPAELISKLEETRPEFIDSTNQVTKRIRGTGVIIPEEKSINADEKKNLCEWLCSHGTKEDFRNFSAIFTIIQDELLVKSTRSV